MSGPRQERSEGVNRDKFLEKWRPMDTRVNKEFASDLDALLAAKERETAEKAYKIVCNYCRGGYRVNPPENDTDRKKYFHLDFAMPYPSSYRDCLADSLRRSLGGGR
jgi:hypothetical protein